MIDSDVVVLIPVYNPALMDLRDTIETILIQTYPADIILVDDGSTVPISSLGCFPSRVEIISLQNNSGITAALYVGMEYALAQGYKYIARLDIGDKCYPNRIQSQIAAMEADNTLDLLGSRARTVDVYGAELYIFGEVGTNAELLNKLRGNSVFRHSTFMFRAESVRRLGNYDREFVLAQDYEVLLRYAKRGKIGCAPEVLVDYEINPKGLSSARRAQQLEMRLKAQLRHFDPTLPSIVGLFRTVCTTIAPTFLVRLVSAILRRKI